jgi:hypothetical protein
MRSAASREAADEDTMQNHFISTWEHDSRQLTIDGGGEAANRSPTFQWPVSTVSGLANPTGVSFVVRFTVNWKPT